MNEQALKIIELSKQAQKQSYSPYSKFAVGAALLCEDGQIFTGCNVENASYGLSMCAERTAVFKAVSEGCQKFKAIAVTCPVKNEYASPCGACRQVLAEFGTDWIIYMTKPDGTFRQCSIADLLPHSFTPESLKLERENA